MGDLTTEQQLQCPTVALTRRLTLSERGFVFDPVTGNSSTVNSIGMAILHQLRQDADVKRAVTVLQQDFDVESHVAERDVIEFAGLLRNQFR